MSDAKNATNDWLMISEDGITSLTVDDWELEAKKEELPMNSFWYLSRPCRPKINIKEEIKKYILNMTDGFIGGSWNKERVDQIDKIKELDEIQKSIDGIIAKYDCFKIYTPESLYRYTGDRDEHRD